MLIAVRGPITQFPWQKHSWGFLVLLLHCTVWKEKLSQLQSYLGVVLGERMGLDLVWQAANICCHGIFLPAFMAPANGKMLQPLYLWSWFSINLSVGGGVSWNEQPGQLTLRWSCWQFLLEIRLPCNITHLQQGSFQMLGNAKELYKE